MLKNKKLTWGLEDSYFRLPGHITFLFFCILLLMFCGTAQGEDKNFSSSSVREPKGTPYFENNNFGTNKEGGPAFITDPETGDRHFRTPEMPKNKEPDDIEILPVRPEVHPVVRPPKPPIIIAPDDGSGK